MSLVKIKVKSSTNVHLTDTLKTHDERLSRRFESTTSVKKEQLKECSDFIEKTSEELDTAYFLATGGTDQELHSIMELLVDKSS